APVMRLLHAQQQAQLGRVGDGPVGGTVRRLRQQVLVVLGPIGTAGFLIGIQPVAQALGVGFIDLQTQQQASELRQRLLVRLALANQAGDVEAAGGILDADQRLAAVIQLEGGSGRAQSSPRGSTGAWRSSCGKSRCSKPLASVSPPWAYCQAWRTCNWL